MRLKLGITFGIKSNRNSYSDRIGDFLFLPVWIRNVDIDARCFAILSGDQTSELSL